MYTAPPFPLETSYCGPAPVPGDLWTRWNLDPVLLFGFLLAGLGFLLLRRGEALRAGALPFWAALGVLAVAFVSPLCALTVALFSARVVHHVLLVALAAPLLAMAMTGRARVPGSVLTPLFFLHTIVFWLWHAPDAYALALSNTAVYWLMQASLLGTATAFWSAVLAAPARGGTLLVLLGATIQMGLLGALLVFAGSPLYLPHIATTAPFGLDPLSDQQLGGLVMWVPASLPYLGVALWQVARWLGDPRAERAR